MTVIEHNPRADRVEVILQQLHTLPTLSPIAMRLLSLTASDESEITEIVKIIESDPSITAKVLSLCRRAETGLGTRITTIDRAVVMLGFEAIRNAVLSVEIYNLFESGRPHESAPTHAVAIDAAPGRPFDSAGFWMHSIAVAVAAESLAKRRTLEPRLAPDEAFVCGLLHDLGKLALERLLPRGYERVVELAEQRQGNIAEMERRVIGLDHHTTGKRLAEQWSLPHVIQDVMWLHGQPVETLPALPHEGMIALVTLADHVVRKQHIGYSGNHVFPDDLATLCTHVGVTLDDTRDVAQHVHVETAQRCEILGLSQTPAEGLFLASIARANQALGRINEALDRRSQAAHRNEQVLRAIIDFHQQATPGLSIVAVCGNVVASAAKEFGRGFFAVLYPSARSDAWQIGQFSCDGRLLRAQTVDVPAAGLDVDSLSDDLQVSVGMLGLLPALSESIGDASDLRNVRLLPLRSGWGLSAVLLHDRPVREMGLSRSQMLALSETWAAAIAAARQHEGARQLGEQLAESNRILTETQAKLARSQALASLGEMAAGAAHEMNNPLCVISGRSQVLAGQLTNPRERRMAEQISEQAQRLSDLITSLHLFTEPPRPEPERVRLGDLVGRAVRLARERADQNAPITVRLAGDLPDAWLDGEQVGNALVELIVNAIEARPRHFIDVQVLVEASPVVDEQSDRSARDFRAENERLLIVVKDDGQGMNEHTLDHAFDPFFSVKPAGRQPGLGLSRAQRLIAANGGVIELESQPNVGSTARIILKSWRVPDDEQTHDAPGGGEADADAQQHAA
ncbi:MAG: HDOD domain-containing protein [Phycisphaerales bacterium]|nr:HDOD domain-containing protein [Phycisphaerales bacterium]